MFYCSIIILINKYNVYSLHVGVSVSLAGGGNYFGRVEISYDGVTGTVCDKSWSSSDARVLCKSLGFADGEPISDSYYGAGTGDIMMSGLGCYGQESSILQCRNHGWRVYNDSDCSNHSRDASVICYKNGKHTLFSDTY